jgi:hypothetical protein
MLKPTTTEDRAREQAQCQMEEISRMIARLDLDWDRLEELRHDRAILDSDNLAELTDLEAIADDCEDQDEAERRIDEDPLSCEVRSGWTSPGEEMTADEYMILLCTGGPACRIVGDLSNGEPTSATLEYQDWGTPWTEYYGEALNQADLISYASRFYFA